MAQKQSEENITRYLQEQINALSQDIEVVQIPNKGKGLQSLKNVSIDTPLFSETPFVSMQHVDNHVR